MLLTAFLGATRMCYGPSMRALFLALALVFVWSPLAWAEEETLEPGDEVRFVLSDGRTLVGLLIGVDEDAYRLSFAGAEIEVAKASIEVAEIVTKEALLEEMRPDDIGATEPSAPPPEPEAEMAPVPGPNGPPPPLDAEEVTEPPVAAPAGEDAGPPPMVAPPGAPRRNGPPPPVIEGDIPPKPESRGGPLMVTGFVLLGAGLATVVSVTVASTLDVIGNRSRSLDVDTQATLVLVGSGVALTGAGLATTGIIQKIVSGSRQRRWQRRYGTLVPVLAPEHAGVAWVARF